MTKTALILCALLCALLSVPIHALATTIVAADQAGGYSDQVLEKVARHWNPPLDTAERKVRVRVSVDSEGKVLRCEPVASSTWAAMDKAACAAVREAGAFGTPPYALPLDVYLAFWTSKPAPPVFAHEARAESAEAKYSAAVAARVRARVVLPPKLPDGKYTIHAEARVDASGRITQSRLTRRSGNTDMDNALMRALARAEKMPVPPNKGTQDVSLVWTFQKP